MMYSAVRRRAGVGPDFALPASSRSRGSASRGGEWKSGEVSPTFACASVRGSDPRTVPKAGVAGDVDYIYEPGAAQILSDLLPKHIEIQVYRALLESAAAEHAARMTAMDAATKNSAELIENLTLYMNKVRQAAITREIIEVVSGAQAL
jgi:ATP synthase F1 gamma subunit